jgi:DNA-directed RNA polymerase subunit N (RpoN/RPB10)
MDKIVDIWVNYDFYGDDRWLQILGDDHVSAGHRLDTRFRYADGSPVRYIPCGLSSAETWENFIQGFENELEKPDALPDRGFHEVERTKRKRKTKRRKKR